MADKQLYWLWLSCSGLGTLKQLEAFRAFGVIENLFAADAAELTRQALDKSIVSKLSLKNLDKAKGILSECAAKDIQVLCYDDPDYPALLKKTIDPPVVLYVRGHLDNMADELPLAMVGTRSPSVYASQIAQQFSYEIASGGLTIVSGMARGIDTLCHRGALRAGKRTIAVLGCGVDIAYPSENSELKRIIEANGAVVSQFPPGTAPHAGNFPLRNSIISGLCLGVFVLEGTLKSGTMITVKLANEQGREVFALPTNIDNIRGTGNNLLIQQGAKMVLRVSDIFEEFALSYTDRMQNSISKSKKLKDPSQQLIVELLNPSVPVQIDDICRRANMSAAAVNSALTMLELSGSVSRLPGKKYILKG